MKAVRFDEYGDVDVLTIAEVPTPEPGPGQVLVQVKAAGINPGEAKIREGLLHQMWPSTFPSGQGSDLAGLVSRTGPGVTGVSVGEEVIGYTDNRASQAEYVVVEEQNLTAKPAALPWEVAGSLFVAGATAYAAVRAVALTRADTVVVSGAAGGVGSDRRPAGAAGRGERERAGRAGRPDRRGRARGADRPDVPDQPGPRRLPLPGAGPRPGKGRPDRVTTGRGRRRSRARSVG
jgi:D-arabinose 1-dehydrogenase-like Zn-dependent alcohol dehydrogenase